MRQIYAYIGKPIPQHLLAGEMPLRELTDWHGTVLGTCRITRTWKTPRSYVSSTMSQVYAWVGGVCYTGRSAGEGMLFKGRPVATKRK